jgi:hypothetical protein
MTSSLLKNFTIFVSLIMGSLFSLGFLYETVYLEGFGLNNSELAPEVSTSIAYGFRYAFLNGFMALFYLSAYGLFSLFFFDSFKADLSNWFNGNQFLSKHLKSTNSFLSKPLPKLYFPLGLVLLAVALWLNAIVMGTKLANEIKEEKAIECILIEGKDSLEGHVVRVRDNLIVFWEKETEQTYIFPQKKLNQLIYKSCPNKPIKQD